MMVLWGEGGTRHSITLLASASSPNILSISLSKYEFILKVSGKALELFACSPYTPPVHFVV